MILALGLEALHVAESFPVTLYAKLVQPILSIIIHLLGEEDATIANKATLGFLKQILQPEYVLNIPPYLSKAIRFQMHHFSTTSYFKY